MLKKINNTKILTKRKVGKIFGITDRTVDTWVKKGMIREHKMYNGQCRFTHSDIQRLCQQLDDDYDPKKMITVGQAAKYLGIKYDDLRYRVRLGWFRSVRLPGLTRVFLYREEIEKYKEKKQGSWIKKR